MEDFIKILIAIFVCFIIILVAKYYFENKRKNKRKVAEPSSSEEPVEKKEKLTDVIMGPNFIKSEWVGSKPGYVFYRSDEHGLGYHLDIYTRNEKGEWIPKEK